MLALSFGAVSAFNGVQIMPAQPVVARVSDVSMFTGGARAPPKKAVAKKAPAKGRAPAKKTVAKKSSPGGGLFSSGKARERVHQECLH